MLWSLGIAVVAILAILGTDRLGRPLTAEESKSLVRSVLAAQNGVDYEEEA